jgi:hypothetical protein
MAQDGAVAFGAASASGSAPGGQPSLELLTVAASAPGATPSFEVATAEGEGSAASTASSGHSASFRPAAASGVGSAGSVAEGDAAFADLTASAASPAYTDISFSPMSAAATGLTGAVARGAVSFEGLSPDAASSGGSMAAGAPRFQEWTASSQAIQAGYAAGAVAFLRTSVAGASLGGGVASGAPVLEPMSAALAALFASVAQGAVTFERMRARGLSEATLSDANRTWVLNAGNLALTEYQNYPFDSFASFAGQAYGAGPDGLFLLDGADDAGEDIAWSFRTGMIDGKEPNLKRLEEVLLAMRFDGPVRVRVWTDESTYFDYNVSNFRPGVLHQVRTRLGRGLRSRFYRVEVSGVGNTVAEVHSMQLPFIPLQRRVG